MNITPYKMVPLILAACLSTGCCRAGEAEPLDGKGEDAPPSIEYPSSRSSTSNIDAGGVKLAVDQGIEWKGVKVYLSLTFELLGIDAASGKTLWHRDVGAFWTGMRIKEVETDGQKVWAVELHGRAHDDQFDTHYYYYELKSGKAIDLPPPQPAGVSLLPLMSIPCGCAVARQFSALITTEAGFDAFWKRMNGPPDPVEREDLLEPSPPHAGDGLARASSAPKIDFTQAVVMVCCTGDTANAIGFSAVQSFEDDRRILLRVKLNGFQTLGGWAFTRICTLFVLPRRAERTYVLEVDEQNIINGPPMWRGHLRVEKLGDGAHDLDALLPEPEPPPPAEAANVAREIKHYKSPLPPPRTDGIARALRGMEDFHSKCEYDYYLDAAGKEVRHGPFRMYAVEDGEEHTQCKGQYVDGQRDGLWTMFEHKTDDWSKLPPYTETYERGKRHGAIQVFDLDGKLRETGAFDHGFATGPWISFQNGVKTAERTYAHGLLDGPYRMWRTDGRKVLDAAYVQGQLAGSYTRWYDNGTVAEKGAFVAGESAPMLVDAQGAAVSRFDRLHCGYRDGEWVRFGKDGRELWRGTFFRGSGTLAEFDDNGTRLLEGPLVNGVFSGEVRTWTGQGRLLTTELIVPGGTSTRIGYHVNGKRESETHFTGNCEVGTARWWDRDGNLEAEGEWRFGLPWSGKCKSINASTIQTFADGKPVDKPELTRESREQSEERQRAYQKAQQLGRRSGE